MSPRFLGAVLLLSTGCADVLPSMPLLTKTTEGDIEVELLDSAVLPGVVEDADFDVKLYDERQTWYLGTYIDTDAWGPVMLADAELRAAGEAPILEVGVEGLAWDHDEELLLTVELGSRYGWTTRAEAGADAIVAPKACSLVVTRDTTDAEHAAHLVECFRSWAELDGSPAGLSIDVAATSKAADWSYAAHWTLATARPVEAACTGPQIAGPIDQSAFRNAEVDTLDLWGNVSADGDVNVYTWENTFRVGDPTPNAGGLTHRRMSGASGAMAEERTFPADWADRSLDTLADPMGFVDACAVVVHESDPDDVTVRFAATVSWSL